MNDKTRRYIEEILPLLDGRQFDMATAIWRRNQSLDGYCRGTCPFGETTEAMTRCAVCLEGSLRAIALIASEAEMRGGAYRHAANALQDWREEDVEMSE
jgi:hypothetical protein